MIRIAILALLFAGCVSAPPIHAVRCERAELREGGYLVRCTCGDTGRWVVLGAGDIERRDL